MKKSAIEDASVEMLEVFERVSAEAKHEKNAVPPANKIVYYWTRKPLIVGRAVALACTLEKPEQVEELLGINADTRAYKRVPTTDAYKKMLGVDPLTVKMLDPFAGTGNLALPSTELGLAVTCSDYNPLAHIIEQGVLEIPVTSGPGLADKFRYVANKIRDEVEDEVGCFYKPGYLVYIWAWCIRCTHCRQRVPLLNQMYLSKKRKIGLRFTPTQNKNFKVDIIRKISSDEGKSFTQKYGKAQCISCGNTIGYNALTQDIAKRKDREMLAIQIQKPGKQGRDYILPMANDKKQYLDALKYLEANNEWMKYVPLENIYKDPRNPLSNYGIEKWDEFFSNRQLLILSTLVKKIKAFESSDTIKVYLSFLVAQLVNRYSYGVVWHTGGEKPEPALAFRQPRIVFNLAEINPFEKVSGSLQNNTANIAKAIEFCARLKSPALCKRESVTVPSDMQYDLIITDPPYGDDVQYGELSEFFYLWMYRILNDKTLPARAPLDEDFCESQGRFGDKKMASEFFEKGLEKSFVAINLKLKDDGLLAVFFAHTSIRAWNQLLLALRAGGFRVVSSYALHTESTANPLAKNKASFMSSIVVACRKITDNSSGFMEDIIPNTEDKIADILAKIPNNKLLTIPITDLLIMVYGKVLESCTRYRTLKSRSGSANPDFESLLSNAQSVIMRLLVSRLTKSSMNTIGPRMAFYILVKVFQGGKATSDEMLKITKAYNIEPAVLMKSSIMEKIDGVYRLTYLHQNEVDIPPESVERSNLHQQLCYLACQVDTGKTKAVDDILDKENFMRSTLKQIVHLLLQSINMRKNRGESTSNRDRDELDILKTLADMMGVRAEGGLDAFGFK